MRLNRYLASAGLGSRRSVEEIIKSGRVKINGHIVIELATQVQPGDCVKVGSKIVKVEQTLTAVINKPKGYLCTAEDEHDRRTIFDLLPQDWPRVFHVGRLDKESEGLLIVTNDGDLAMTLTHPSHQIDKEYEVGLDKPFDPAHRDKLTSGIRIEGGLGRVEHVNVVTPQLIKLTLRQGIKRQIRHMLYSLGYEVTYLRRIRIGPLRIGALKPAHWRLLANEEIDALKASKPVPADPTLRKRKPRPYTPRTPALPKPASSETAAAPDQARREAPHTHARPAPSRFAASPDAAPRREDRPRKNTDRKGVDRARPGGKPATSRPGGFKSGGAKPGNRPPPARPGGGKQSRKPASKRPEGAKTAKKTGSAPRGPKRS